MMMCSSDTTNSLGFIIPEPTIVQDQACLETWSKNAHKYICATETPGKLKVQAFLLKNISSVQNCRFRTL